MKQRIGLLVLVVLLCLTLCACDPLVDAGEILFLKVAEKTKDINYSEDSYEEFWNDAETYPCEQGCYGNEIIPFLFPASLDDLNVKDFTAELTKNLLGEVQKCEICLSVCYDSKETFEVELSRLNELAPIGESEYFDYPAAIMILGWWNYYEYALIEHDALTIHYIYLARVMEDEVDIPTQYVPDDLRLIQNGLADELNLYYLMTENEKEEYARKWR